MTMTTNEWVQICLVAATILALLSTWILTNRQIKKSAKIEHFNTLYKAVECFIKSANDLMLYMTKPASVPLENYSEKFNLCYGRYSADIRLLLVLLNPKDERHNALTKALHNAFDIDYSMGSSTASVFINEAIVGATIILVHSKEQTFGKDKKFSLDNK